MFKLFTNNNKKKEQIYLKAIEKVRHTDEYLHNKMIVDNIRKVIIACSDIPEEVVDWLIQGVKDNAELELEACKKADTYNLH